MQRSRPGVSVHIDKTADTRLILARINDWHRRFHFYNESLFHSFNKLQERILAVSSYTSKTVAYKRADKTARQHHVQAESKLTRFQRAKTKRHKTDENWFKRNYQNPPRTALRSRIASTLQSAILTNCNLTNDERQVLNDWPTTKHFSHWQRTPYCCVDKKAAQGLWGLDSHTFVFQSPFWPMTLHVFRWLEFKFCS